MYYVHTTRQKIAFANLKAILGLRTQYNLAEKHVIKSLLRI
jgi:hypothetical protein